MSETKSQAMKENICIHATPIGICSNLYMERITIKDVYWFEELGSIEAGWILELDDLGPFLVDIDSEGRNHFDALDVIIDNNRKKAYKDLNIPQDFEYTKLY